MKVAGSRSQMQRLLPRESNGTVGTAVKTMTLDSVLRDFESVDLLKMDIEGGEYEVLYGSAPETLRKIRRITLEYHPDEGSPAELLAYLKLHGLELVHNVHNAKGYGLATLERGLS